MITIPLSRLAITIFSLLCLCAHIQAENIVLEDKKGRKTEVTLIERQGDKISVKRIKDGKQFLISPSQLSEKSGKELAEKAKTLKKAIPPLEIDAVIGKRRRHYNGSYYMKAMNITSKVTVTNKDSKVPCPALQGNIIFIGQDQRSIKTFQVLSNQKFNITPTTRGETFESKPFVTTYDSDNKGDGNIGGFKYVGYLVVLRDSDGKVIETKTTYSVIKKAMEKNISTAGRLVNYPKLTTLNSDLEKSGDIGF